MEWIVDVATPPLQPASSVPANGYVAEDGLTSYTAEDAATFYVQES